MTESRNSNVRTSRKGKVQIYINEDMFQIYINEDMFDAVMDLQDKSPAKMLEYIKNLKTSPNKDFTAQSVSPKVCPKCKEDIQIYINDEGEEEERCYCSML